MQRRYKKRLTYNLTNFCKECVNRWRNEKNAAGARSLRLKNICKRAFFLMVGHGSTVKAATSSLSVEYSDYMQTSNLYGNGWTSRQRSFLVQNWITKFQCVWFIYNQRNFTHAALWCLLPLSVYWTFLYSYKSVFWIHFFPETIFSFWWVAVSRSVPNPWILVDG